MTVFRWILGVLWALLAAGGVLTFLLYIVTGNDHWGTMARRFRRWVWAASLFWFNVEIWGRVFWTLLHWT